MKEKFSILVVDDELIVRKSLGCWLLSEGYDVDTADNGLDALEMIKSNNYNLAIVDIKMPGMDGMELLNKIKSFKPEIEVIIITAYSSVNTAVQAMKDGAYDYIVKPFDPITASLIIQRAVKFELLKRENNYLKERIALN